MAQLVDIYRRLMDAVDPALVDRAEDALRTTSGVESVESVQLRWVGHRVRAEAGVTVDPTTSLVEAHEVAVAAHHRLLHQIPELVDATVHVSPAGHWATPNTRPLPTTGGSTSEAPFPGSSTC